MNLIASWKTPAFFYTLFFLVDIYSLFKTENYLVHGIMIFLGIISYNYLLSDCEEIMKKFLKVRHDHEIQS